MADDTAAIIVAVVGEHGKLTTVRRFRVREADRAEQWIVAYVDAGKQLRVTFIDRHDGTGIDDDDRARLTELASV